MALVSTPLSVLHLAVKLDATDLYGVIEWTLANARRTGVSLQHLHVPGPALPQPPTSGQRRDSAWLWLSVGATEPGLLTLFRHRLEGGFDVLHVEQLAEAGQPVTLDTVVQPFVQPFAGSAQFATVGSSAMPSSAAAQGSRTMETKSRANGRSANAVGGTA
jgi:hypothetical protein